MFHSTRDTIWRKVSKKILIHGGLVVNSVLMPIGQMSEEAQEARNKD